MTDLFDELGEVVKGCSRCGFCMVECPAYGATKIEWDVARGRIKLARQVVNGELDLDKEIDDPVDTCLRCGSCYEICPSKVDTPKAVQIMRTMRYQAGKMKLPYRILFEQAFPYPGRLAKASRLLAGTQALGFDRLINSNLVTRSFPAAKIIPKIPNKRARSILKSNYPARGTKRGKVLYFLGCATDLAYPNVAEATVAALQEQGIDVTIPNVSCCGLPAFTYGHIDGAKTVARQNLLAMKIEDFDTVVSDCPTCTCFLKEYTDLFKNNDPLEEKAALLANKVQHVPDYLVSMGMHKLQSEVKYKVTYHQPCHTGRYPGAAKSVEELLESLPGIEFIKADNQNTCCGGAGSYCFTQFERSEKILAKKIEGITETEAEFVVTNCPACMMQLDYGIKRFVQNYNPKLVNLMELISMAYKSGL